MRRQLFFGPASPWIPFARPVGVAGPPVVQRVGPSFALLVPATYMVEMQPPEAGLHAHRDHLQAVVGPGTAAIFVVIIVLVIVTGKVVAWVVRASDTR